VGVFFDKGVSIVLIDRAPPEVDFVGIVFGAGEQLSWELGTENTAGAFTPEDLTGRAAVVVLSPGLTSQLTLPATTDGGWVRFTLPDTLDSFTAYLLLVEDHPGQRKVPRVQGTVNGDWVVAP
jgi:hypothetical protein